MSQRIRQDDIDRVRDATDIVEVAAETLTVKRKRNVAWALCPFHQEKSPSFKMDSATGLYYCFGCGQAGNVFQFLERTQGLTFAEAVERLAQRAGVNLQYEGAKGSSGRDKRGRLTKALEAAVTYFQQVLIDDAADARAYLESRGIGVADLEHFHLGFAPGGWDQLSRHLRKTGFTEDEVLGAGLAFRNDRGRLTDQFRERITFPIFDPADKPIAFGARAMGDAKPKYKNSASSPIYDKAKTLYGLNWARSQIVSGNEVIVVEGYTDVIGLHQIGIANAVATCGTAMGEGHFEALRRFGPAGGDRRLKVLLAFDADAAGEAASKRGFELQHKFGFDVRVVELPAGTDPADAARSDPDGVRAAIESAVPLMRFKLRSDLARFDLSVPEHRADAVRAAAASVALHPDQLVRHEYAHEVAYATGIDVDAVRLEIEATVKGRSSGGSHPAFEGRPPDAGTATGAAPGAARRLDELDALILRHLLIGSDETRAALIKIGPGAIRGKGATKIFEMLATKNRPDASLIMGDLADDDPIRAVIGHVMLETTDADDSGRDAQVVVDAERRVLRIELERLAEIVKQDLPDAEIEEASRRYNDIQTRLKALR